MRKTHHEPASGGALAAYPGPMFMPHAQDLAVSASQRRLQDMLTERAQPGADTVALDQRIRDLFEERWAVMFTDLSGFSRRVAEFGIIHFLAVIQESLRLFSPVIDAHDGIVLKVEADSLLVIFRRPERALACARAMQAACAAANADRAPEDRVLLCVGLGYGDVLRIGDDDVFGPEVNAASKLGEDIAKAGEILVTSAVHTACPDLGPWSPAREIPAGTTEAWATR